MTPHGDGPGLPRTPADEADLAWLKETAAAGIASRPAHRAQVQAIGGDYFRAWCSTCSTWVSAKGKDKAVQRFLAGSHERAHQ